MLLISLLCIALLVVSATAISLYDKLLDARKERDISTSQLACARKNFERQLECARWEIEIEQDRTVKERRRAEVFRQGQARVLAKLRQMRLRHPPHCGEVPARADVVTLLCRGGHRILYVSRERQHRAPLN